MVQLPPGKFRSTVAIPGNFRQFGKQEKVQKRAFGKSGSWVAGLNKNLR